MFAHKRQLKVNLHGACPVEIHIVRSFTIILFLYQIKDIHVSSIAMFYVAFDIVMFIYACLLLKTTTLFSQRWLAYIEGVNLHGASPVVSHRPKGRVQAALAPCLLAPDALCTV